MTGCRRLDRRRFLAAAGATGGLLLAGGVRAGRDYSGDDPVRYPDPDILHLDPRFGSRVLGNAAIERLHTGSRWLEGPAWSAVGRYLVFSDIPNDRQLRYVADDGRVSVFRHPAGMSNGNTFDFEGRQIAFEHAHRRVVRYEHDGSVSVLASRYRGKPLNAPNDGAVHPDGSIWFTDPGYGSLSDYEGNRGALELPEAVYRLDPANGELALVTDEPVKPNGLCFSPDYKTLYVSDSGAPPPAPVHRFDVTADGRLANRRVLCTMAHDGRQGVADGLRADVDGNLWLAAGWGGEGFDGVHVVTPDGERIGVIRLPEICANLCFGGERRNRLFMTASQSLYAVYVATRGAHIC